jgi:acyl carrier protein
MGRAAEWSRTEIERALRSFIAEELFYGADQGALANDQPLQETGVIDSMGMLRLVTFLEETFGIEVLDSEVVPEHLGTLGGIISFIERKRSAI